MFSFYHPLYGATLLSKYFSAKIESAIHSFLDIVLEVSPVLRALNTCGFAKGFPFALCVILIGYDSYLVAPISQRWLQWFY